LGVSLLGLRLQFLLLRQSVRRTLCRRRSYLNGAPACGPLPAGCAGGPGYRRRHPRPK